MILTLVHPKLFKIIAQMSGFFPCPYEPFSRSGLIRFARFPAGREVSEIIKVLARASIPGVPAAFCDAGEGWIGRISHFFRKGGDSFPGSQADIWLIF